mmetsp:Transcript_14331/g.16017  ORF Transcript_14331/g.16017 Transcript_14331/m.16017 type:complete len:81 (+) Transcript_14331:13-255(+)
MENDLDVGDQQNGWFNWTKDKVQNGTIAVIDEIQFWGEVAVDYWNQEDTDAHELLKEYQDAVKQEKLAKQGNNRGEDEVI